MFNTEFALEILQQIEEAAKKLFIGSRQLINQRISQIPLRGWKKWIPSV